MTESVIKLVCLEDRRDVYLRISKIAGVVVLKDGGPSCVLFDGGGSLDVCGSAEIIWRQIRLLEMKLDTSAQL
jgi:hypothetical protein